jgi:hypothetical protein
METPPMDMETPPMVQLDRMQAPEFFSYAAGALIIIINSNHNNIAHAGTTNSFTHVRVLLVLTDISAQCN